MKSAISQIHESLAKALNALPGVFSTVQWGGRAYKLPGPGSRGTKKPVLLTHVCLNKAADAVCLGFRLEKPRAKSVMRQHEWIKPNSFGSLKNNGWVETQVRTKAQCKVIIALLRESRLLHPMPEGTSATANTVARNRARGADRKRRAKAGSDGNPDPVALRMDVILRQKREEGWKPARADAFDA